MLENSTITIHEIIERNARAGLNYQRNDGSFPPGENYPYGESITPVRHTSAWARILAKAYEITNERVFAEAANQALDYLLSSDVRPYGYTFYCRDVTDKCNGLVGQARAIQALVYAGDILNRSDALKAAEEVFMLHPFDESIGLWECVEIDGSRLSFDRTLNHQITFAAAAADLDIAQNCVSQFLTNLGSNMQLHSDGLIKHYIRPPVTKVLNTVITNPKHYNLLINEFVSIYYDRSEKRRLKEKGYHITNLLSLSLIKEAIPGHSVWECEKISKSLSFLERNREVIAHDEENKYGHPVKAICEAIVQHKFGKKSIESISYAISSNIADCISNKDNLEIHIGSDSGEYLGEIRRTHLLLGLPNFEIELS